MIKRYLTLLLHLSRRRTSKYYKIFSLMVGTVFFLIILPGLFFYGGVWLSRFLTITWPWRLELIIALLSISGGLFFVSWATLNQWRIGGGTPAPMAPTQKLVIQGPYKLCRNPIELGAILYYLGVGTAFGSFTIGIFSALLGFLIGSSYHKLVEEKDLELRFGAEYLKYKQTTPFLIPRVYKKETGVRN
jgi:protein-S-isoprenylcysteine O-methyltransferase Ste14